MKNLIGVVLAAGMSTATAAADMIEDKDLCEKAVEYSVKYIPEENGGTLHQARWNIIEGKRTDDNQKLVSLVIFEIGQRLSYTYDSEIHDPDVWFPEQIAMMNEACEAGIMNLRGNEIREIESANPDEAW